MEKDRSSTQSHHRNFRVVICLMFVFQSLPRSPIRAKEKAAGGSSGPSSLNAGALPASYRRASEGGANLYMKGRKNASGSAAEKTNEI